MSWASYCFLLREEDGVKAERCSGDHVDELQRSDYDHQQHQNVLQEDLHACRFIHASAYIHIVPRWLTSHLKANPRSSATSPPTRYQSSVASARNQQQLTTATHDPTRAAMICSERVKIDGFLHFESFCEFEIKFNRSSRSAPC